VVMDSIRRGNGLTVGIENLKISNFSVRIYPNPIDNSSVLSVNSDVSAIAQIMIYNALGKIQSVRNVQLIPGINKYPFVDLLDAYLAKGIYHVNIVTDSGVDYINVFAP